MGYPVAYTPDALRGLGQLDSRVQETVLDIVEAIAARPFTPRRRSSGGLCVTDFVHETEGVRETVFIISQVDHARHIVNVVRIAHFR